MDALGAERARTLFSRTPTTFSLSSRSPPSSAFASLLSRNYRQQCSPHSLLPLSFPPPPSVARAPTSRLIRPHLSFRFVKQGTAATSHTSSGFLCSRAFADILACTQCQAQQITWSQTTGPYNLIVVSAADPCGDDLYVLSRLSSNCLFKFSRFAALTSVTTMVCP